MSHHVLRYPHIGVALAVVYLKDQSNKVGEDGRGACLSLDRWYTLTSLGPDDGQAEEVLIFERSKSVV